MVMGIFLGLFGVFLVRVFSDVYWGGSGYFREIFGFPDRLYKETLGSQGNAQAWIDAVLKQRAELFLSFCELEHEILKNRLSFDYDSWETNHKRKHKKDLQRVQRLIRLSKKSFWFAHYLAERKGFAVKEKARDYVSG